MSKNLYSYWVARKTPNSRIQQGRLGDESGRAYAVGYEGIRGPFAEYKEAEAERADDEVVISASCDLVFEDPVLT